MVYLNPDPDTWVYAEVFEESWILKEFNDFFFKLHRISFVEVCTIWHSVLSRVTWILLLSLLLAGNPDPLIVNCSPATEPLFGEKDSIVGRIVNSYFYPNKDVFKRFYGFLAYP